MIVRLTLALDEGELLDRLTRILESVDCVAEHVAPPDLHAHQLRFGASDILVIARVSLPKNAEEALMSFADLPESPYSVVLTSYDDAEEQARLTAAGAIVLPSGATDDALGGALQALIEKRRESFSELVNENTDSEPRLSDFVSHSPVMQAFLQTVRRVSGSNASLLILGETGVGKEHLARAVHAESNRADGPFVAVNCGAIPDALLESELFGHEKGAFTGASRTHRGWFELAHTGTLFLDEVGELPLHLQVKLLRVLQFREFRRVGGEAEIKVDVRIMAATNRDPAIDIEAGRFRADLFYRLSVILLAIPPLRERKEDIAALAKRLVRDVASELGRRDVEIESGALSLLREYLWPGNVRELRNVLERALLLSADETVRAEDLPPSVAQPAFFARIEGEASAAGLEEDFGNLSFFDARKMYLDSFERRYLSFALRKSQGKIGDTAAMAGITPRSLYAKMKQHGLRKEDYRES